MWAEKAMLSGFITFVLVCLLALFRVVLIRRIDLVSWFLLSLGAFHGLGMCFVAWTVLVGNTSSDSMRLAQYEDWTWVHAAAVVLFAIAVWLGGFVARRALGLNQRPVVLRAPLDPGSYRTVSLVAWCLLIVSLAGYWLYSRAYGGFGGLLAVSVLIRSGLFESLPSNPWSWLRPVTGGLSFFASFAFFGLLLAGRPSKYRLVPIVGLMMAVFFSLFVLQSWQGRSDFIFYLLAFVLGFVVYRYGFRLSILIRLLPFFVGGFIILLVFGSTLVGKMDEGEAVSSLILRELVTRLEPFFVHVERSEFRWMKDVAAIPLYFLPQRIWKVKLNLDTAVDVTTELILGGRKGVGGITGGLNVDLVTFSYLQAGVPGLVFLGLLWGAFLRLFDSALLTGFLPGVRETVYAYLALRMVASSSYNGNPHIVIQNNIGVIAGLLVLFFVIRVLPLRTSGRFTQRATFQMCAVPHRMDNTPAKINKP